MSKNGHLIFTGTAWGWSASSFTLSLLPFFHAAVASGFLQLLRCWQSRPSKADSQQLCSAITQLSLPQIPSAPTHFCRLRCLKRPLLWSSPNTYSSPTPWTLTFGAGTLKISSVKTKAREALSNSAFLQGTVTESPATAGPRLYLYSNIVEAPLPAFELCCPFQCQLSSHFPNIIPVCPQNAVVLLPL